MNMSQASYHSNPSEHHAAKKSFYQEIELSIPGEEFTQTVTLHVWVLIFFLSKEEGEGGERMVMFGIH